jgi:hypothetical protein
MKSKVILVTASLAVLAFLGGLLAGWMLSSRTEKTAVAFGVGRLLTEEAKLLETVYYSSVDKETKLAVLKHYSSFMEQAGSATVPLIGEKAYKTDAALAYARIGLLLGELNRPDESKEYFQKAVAVKPDSSVEELTRTINAIDKAHNSMDKAR